MKYWHLCRLMIVFTGITTSLKAQTKDLVPDTWNARWISVAGAEPSAYGVYHFRKQVELTNYSGPFIIHLSADQQYRLYVNGKFTGMGPARFDLANWYYETIDIGPYLKFGTNVIAVEVINFGQYKPLARFTQGTGLIVQGHTQKEAALINTGTTTWKAAANEAIDVWPVKTGSFYGAYPGDSIIAQYQPWGWEQAGYKDAAWKPAEAGMVAELQGSNSRYWRLLTPEATNPLTVDKQHFINVEGIDKTFLTGTRPVTIAAKHKISLLFDAGRQTIGFPELLLSGGLDADINITYIPEYKDAPELQDYIKPDGATRRLFSPTGYRSFRYVKMDIATGKTALTLLDYSNLYTQQLLIDKSSFASGTELDTLWGSAKALTFAGAQDFLVDNPFSGQLQLIGNASVQGQAIAAMTGDLKLLKQAIWQANESRIPEGLIRSAYPADSRTVTVTGSLQWIDAIQSYLMLKDDKEMAKELYPGITAILNWFKKYQDVNTGLATAKMPYRNAPLTRLTYQYLYALRQAAQVAGYCSQPADSVSYTKTADKLREILYQRCYNAESGVVAEKEGETAFTRCTNAFAVLGQAIPPKQTKNVLQRAFTDKNVSRNEKLWEKYFVFKAMQENGYTELFGEELKSIAGMYEQKDPEFFTSAAGLVNLYMLGITAGIQPASYGYRTVLIAPEPGSLSAVKAAMMHPDGGAMSVDLQFSNNRVKGKVNLPFGITGKFRWRGKEITLHGGPQDINL